MQRFTSIDDPRQDPPAQPARGGRRRTTLDVLRGALIGTAEVVPGISGGTVALVVGVYDRLINAAASLLSAAGRLLRHGPRHARVRDIEWSVLLAVLSGMAVAVVVAARLLTPLLESFPAGSRAVFTGMVLASLVVPLQMMGGLRRWRDAVLLVAAAALAAVLSGLPPGTISEPPLPLVALAASVAVCALVLPGVSGSFLLLTVGLYAPTLAAVNEGDVAYLAVFALGAVAGLALFVELLRWLLAYRRKATLAVMTGLMLGSLRALWPWQQPDRTLLAPTGDVLGAVLLALAGAVLVAGLLALEHRTGAGNATARDAGKA